MLVYQIQDVHEVLGFQCYYLCVSILHVQCQGLGQCYCVVQILITLSYRDGWFITP